MPKRKYNDDDLRAAVASSKTYCEVIEKLGLGIGGRTYRQVERRIEHLGLDTSNFTLRAKGAPPCSDDALREAVSASTSFPVLMAHLGLDLDPATEEVVRRRIKYLGIVTLHFVRTHATTRKRMQPRWSDDALRAAVASSVSYAGVMRTLGLIPAGGNYGHVQRRVLELSLDTSHFTGQAWNVGRKFVPRPALPLEQVLVAGRWTGSHELKHRLFRAGLKTPQCERCGWAEQSPDGRVPVELDHVNGDREDNRIENLRILCPNCHALQPTHRGLNKKSRRTS